MDLLGLPCNPDAACMPALCIWLQAGPPGRSPECLKFLGLPCRAALQSCSARSPHMLGHWPGCLAEA